jgi:hypothetical protein
MSCRLISAKVPEAGMESIVLKDERKPITFRGKVKTLGLHS